MWGLLRALVFALLTLEIMASTSALKPYPKEQQASALNQLAHIGAKGRALLCAPVLALTALEIRAPLGAVRRCHQLLWPSSAASCPNFERLRTVHLLCA